MDLASRVKPDLSRRLEQVRLQNRALESKLVKARKRAGPPARVVTTARGRGVHHEDCHVHQNSPNNVIRLGSSADLHLTLRT